MKRRLGVIHVATEMAPFAKVGGLADVLDGLSRAQGEQGHRVTVVLPGYGSIAERGETVAATGTGQALRHFESRNHPARILLLEDPLFSAQKGIYIDPDTGYVYPEQARRYLGFSRGVLELLAQLDPHPPDVLHVHDHHTALLPALAKEADSFFRDTRTILSIHNLGYQGIYEREELLQAGLPVGMVSEGSPLDLHGRANFLKSGILTADRVSTVSPRYAREITTPEFGCGLDPILAALPDGVAGILNGIDVEVWNPKTDPHIPVGYDAEDMTGKQAAKDALVRRASLTDATRPLLGMVTRLTDQKGMDLVLACASELLDRRVSLVVLGSGDPAYEEQLRTLAVKRAGEVSFSREFDEPLAHLIQAGADIFLMPSRFEPCGLTQMISMRYGTVPVVRRVGGLADTVKEVESGVGGTGFFFDEYTPPAMLRAIDTALRVLGDPERWMQVIREGMRLEFTWKAPAEHYEALYRASSGP